MHNRGRVHIAPGAHLAACGGFGVDTRELGDESVRRSVDRSMRMPRCDGRLIESELLFFYVDLNGHAAGQLSPELQWSWRTPAALTAAISLRGVPCLRAP